MSRYNNINGVTREIDHIYKNINGISKEVNEKWQNVNGVARQTFSKGIVWLVKNGNIVNGLSKTPDSTKAPRTQVGDVNDGPIIGYLAPISINENYSYLGESVVRIQFQGDINHSHGAYNNSVYRLLGNVNTLSKSRKFKIKIAVDSSVPLSDYGCSLMINLYTIDNDWKNLTYNAQEFIVDINSPIHINVRYRYSGCIPYDIIVYIYEMCLIDN